jgi:hypothetical protein
MLIRSAADLPFHARDPIDLLGLSGGLHDPDFATYGHAQLRQLVLADDSERGPLTVDWPLLLAVHSADDAAPLAGDIELEFAVAEEGEELAYGVPLTVFLARWLPPLLAGAPGAQAVVLAVCNPHHALLARPVGLPAGLDLYVPLGDVRAWCDADPDEPTRTTLGLSADRWHIL